MSLRAEPFIGEDREESRRKRDHLLADPPDILVTNHVMLERILTRSKMQALRGQGSLRAIVLDEVHTFRGNVGADVAWLLRRLKASAGTDPVCIGASATLQKHGGYLPDPSECETDPDLEEFLRALFGLRPGQQVKLIEPAYVDEPVAGGGFPEPDWRRLARLDWTDDLEEVTEVEAAFLGEPAPTPADPLAAALMLMDGEPASEDPPGLAERLRNHALVRAWRKTLIDRGALAYGEMVELSAQVYWEQRGRACPAAEALTRACLAAVNHANWLEAEEARAGSSRRRPVLDLVIHGVLRNVNGRVQLCLPCGRYHVGAEEHCSRCGRIRLDCWKEDVAWAAAAVNMEAGALEPIPPKGLTSLDPLVRIARIDALPALPETGERVRLREDEPAAAGFPYAPDANGDFVVVPLGTQRATPSELTISPIETRHSLDYLSLLARRLLQYEGTGARLLVFGDARERVAAAGYVLKEDAATRHLCWHARRERSGAPVPLPDALAGAHRGVRGDESDFHKQLFASIPHWFARLCATSPRRFPEQEGLLVLNPEHPGLVHQVSGWRELATPAGLAAQAPEDAAALLAWICLREGAIDWTRCVPAPSHKERDLFEFDHLTRTQRRVVTFESGVVELSGAETVALTGRGNSIYAEAVNRFSPDLLQSAMQGLVQDGVMLEITDALEESRPGYALSPESVALCPEPAAEEAGGAVVRSFRTDRHAGSPVYQPAEIHSSETGRETRGFVEREFGDPGSCLSQIAATSTLELGVDIGSLRQVLCYGVPPSPASYAQRAGRAGRGRASWYATVFMWCDDRRPHDMFHFQRPDEIRRLLSGQVQPPWLDAANPLVVRRHLFAALVQDRVDDPDALRAMIAYPQHIASTLASELLESFRAALGSQFEEALTGPFVRGVSELTGSDDWSAEDWFASPLCPNYGFRHDEVELRLPREDLPPGMPLESLRSIVVSRRPPEQAVQTWFPDRVVATARGLMRIEQGIVKEKPGEEATASLSADGPAPPCYSAFRVRREEGAYGRRTRPPVYDIEARLHETEGPPAAEAETWLSWRPVRGARLDVVNNGPTTVPRKGADGSTRLPAPWAFRTECEALLVQYDSLLLGKGGFASFACVMMHAVQEHFRLSDGDLLLLPQVKSPFVADPYAAFLLADLGHHGLVCMGRLAEELKVALRQAAERLRDCDCADGCFRCLRTSAAGFLAADARRGTALAVLRALLGEAPLMPEMPPPPAGWTPAAEPVVITIRRSGRWYCWTRSGCLPGQGDVRVEDGQTKPAIRETFLQATEGLSPGTSIRVVCAEKYLIDVLRATKSPTKWDADDERIWFRGFGFRLVGENE